MIIEYHPDWHCLIFSIQKLISRKLLNSVKMFNFEKSNPTSVQQVLSVAPYPKILKI